MIFLIFKECVLMIKNHIFISYNMIWVCNKLKIISIPTLNIQIKQKTVLSYIIIHLHSSQMFIVLRLCGSRQYFKVTFSMTRIHHGTLFTSISSPTWNDINRWLRIYFSDSYQQWRFPFSCSFVSPHIGKHGFRCFDWA